MDWLPEHWVDGWVGDKHNEYNKKQTADYARLGRKGVESSDGEERDRTSLAMAMARRRRRAVWPVRHINDKMIMMTLTEVCQSGHKGEEEGVPDGRADKICKTRWTKIL